MNIKELIFFCRKAGINPYRAEAENLYYEILEQSDPIDRQKLIGLLEEVIDTVKKVIDVLRAQRANNGKRIKKIKK